VGAVSRWNDPADLVPVVERLVEQRYDRAIEAVARLRAEDPGAAPGELAGRLIRRYTKDLALGGAIAGGAAASPVAGMAIMAASAGADAAVSVGRLGEMIMAIGVLYGHDTTTVEQRRSAVLAVMGLADGATIGVSGLAARAGARGGARLLRRLPTAPPPAGAGVARRTAARLARSRGPWSVAALVPYGIGASVGAAGNALLTRAVGRAAQEYFGGSGSAVGPTGHERPDGVEVEVEVIEVDGVEVELVVDPLLHDEPELPEDRDAVDAVIVEPRPPDGRRGP
jgi:hypothetical protein